MTVYCDMLERMRTRLPEDNLRVASRGEIENGDRRILKEEGYINN